MDPLRTKLIACEAVLPEIVHEVPRGVEVLGVDVARHARPESLKRFLQEVVDDSSAERDTILLGYGLCSRSVDGLHSSKSTLVVPRVHDCIGLLLGGSDERIDRSRLDAGTYYLSKGWIESGDHILAEYDRMSERFGEDKARQLMSTMLAHYTRVAFIRTDHDPKLDTYRNFSRGFAKTFDLRFEEIRGTKDMMRRLIQGPWDNDFVIVPPGRAIEVMAFLDGGTA